MLLSISLWRNMIIFYIFIWYLFNKKSHESTTEHLKIFNTVFIHKMNLLWRFVNSVESNNRKHRRWNDYFLESRQSSWKEVVSPGLIEGAAPRPISQTLLCMDSQSLIEVNTGGSPPIIHRAPNNQGTLSDSSAVSSKRCFKYKETF